MHVAVSNMSVADASKSIRSESLPQNNNAVVELKLGQVKIRLTAEGVSYVIILFTLQIGRHLLVAYKIIIFSR